MFFNGYILLDSQNSWDCQNENNDLKCVLDTPELVIHEMQLEFQHTCSDAFGSALSFFFFSSILIIFGYFVIQKWIVRHFILQEAFIPPPTIKKKNKNSVNKTQLASISDLE